MEARLTATVENGLASLIYEKAKKYFDNPDNRTKFEEWYLNKYGVPYVWKTGVKV